MTDYFLRACELLQEIEDLTEELEDEFDRPYPATKVVGDLQGRIGRCKIRAELCNSIAQTQGLMEVSSRLDRAVGL